MRKEDFMKLLMECLIELDDETSVYAGEDYFAEFIRTVKNKLSGLQPKRK